MSVLSERIKSYGRKSLSLMEYSEKKVEVVSEATIEETPVEEVTIEAPIEEATDAGISRLRVQISKLKNKLEKDPKNTKYNAQLSSVVSRKKNLEAEGRIRDVWAKNAEASRNTED